MTSTLQKQLEQATADACFVPAGADNEGTELRAGWLSLVQAFEADGSRPSLHLEEAALMARIVASLEETNQPVITVRSSSADQARQATRAGWLVTGALAAAVLLCVGLVLQRVSQRAVVNEVAEHVEVQPSAVVAAQVAWSDPLDEQISLAESRLQNLHSGLPDLDGSLSTLGDQMGELARDLELGSL